MAKKKREVNSFYHTVCYLHAIRRPLPVIFQRTLNKRQVHTVRFIVDDYSSFLNTYREKQFFEYPLYYDGGVVYYAGLKFVDKPRSSAWAAVHAHCTNAMFTILDKKSKEKMKQRSQIRPLRFAVKSQNHMLIEILLLRTL